LMEGFPDAHRMGVLSDPTSPHLSISRNCRMKRARIA
jgi:hypothetical protein